MGGGNRARVLEFIRLKHPAGVTTSEIVRRTGVSQPQVYQIMRALMESRMVRAARDGRAWRYTYNAAAARPAGGAVSGVEDFAETVRNLLAAELGADVRIAPQAEAANVFLLSAPEADAAATAIHFSAPPEGRIPPARLAFINGHLWLLEKTEAERLLLILGGDGKTARAWAERFAPLCLDVEVRHMEPEGRFVRLA